MVDRHLPLRRGLAASLTIALVAACTGINGPSHGPSASPSDVASPEPSASAAASLRPTATPFVPDLGGTWTARVPLPEPRPEHSVTALDGWIYAAGGFVDRETSASFVGFEIATQTWHELAPLPERRDHTAMVAVGGAVYVIGGGILGLGAVRADVWRYDPGSDSWT